MFATPILRGVDPRREDSNGKPANRCCVRMRANAFTAAAWLAMAIILPLRVVAGESPVNADKSDFSSRAHAAFIKTRAEYQSDTNSAGTAWQFGRACFDWAEYAESKSARAEIARQGIAATRRALAIQPNSAPAHYYLAMNLGQLARTELLGALRLVDQMEQEFSLAAKLDEHLDYAGPDRNLGLLYSEAPAFGSIGSRTKARQHLLRAVQLAPDYPENRLNLMEAYLKWDETASARRQLKALDQLLPAARKKFSGDEWASSWVDWEKRLKEAREKLQVTTKPLLSPRQTE